MSIFTKLATDLATDLSARLAGGGVSPFGPFAARVPFRFDSAAGLRVVTDPASILGPNLALWLQSDHGTGAGPAVSTWTDLAGNGNATTFGASTAMRLVANSFGTKPGVACLATTQALRATLSVPLPGGLRPYLWARIRMTAAPDTVGTYNLNAYKASPFGSPSADIQFGCAGPTVVPPSGLWASTYTSIALPDSQATIAPVDLLPHTVQVAQETDNALVFDETVVAAALEVTATPSDIDTVGINDSEFSPFAPGFDPGFANFGVIVVSFDRPTPAQAAAVRAYCDAYGV